MVGCKSWGWIASLLLLPSSLLAQAPAPANCTLVYFQSSQCGPCRQFEPVLQQLQATGWDVRKIDAPAQLDLAKQYQIKNLPTVVVLSDGREVDRLVGAISYDQIASRLNRVAARHRPAAPSPTSLPSGGELVAVASPGQPIVRGQSPGVGEAFPLLASAATNEWNNATSELLPSITAASRSSAAPGVQSAAAVVSAVRPTLTIEQAIARAADATVRIRVEESNTLAHGTGTIVALHGDEALVLTCGHLFRDMLPGSKLTVDLFAGTPRQTNVVAQLIDFTADKEDIGLLSVKLPVHIEPVVVLPRSEQVQKGQPAFSFGCDHGANPTRRDTRVTNVNRYLGPANVEIDGAPAVGRSGGGLFDTQGRLIGVCNAACNEDNEGIYAAADVIYQQLARIDHGHLFESSPPSTLASANEAAVPGTNVPSASTMAAQSPSAAQTNWPDEDPRFAGQSLAGASAAAQPAAVPAQLICVMRDASGKDRVITIAQPSRSLIAAIEQHGVANP